MDAKKRSWTGSTGLLAYRLSLDGALGIGETVVTSGLSVDTRLITALVDDSGGLAGSNIEKF